MRPDLFSRARLTLGCLSHALALAAKTQDGQVHEATIMVAAISTSCWTCWTSLVERVIRLGAPNFVTSCSETPPHG